MADALPRSRGVSRYVFPTLIDLCKIRVWGISWWITEVLTWLCHNHPTSLYRVRASTFPGFLAQEVKCERLAIDFPTVGYSLGLFVLATLGRGYGVRLFPARPQWQFRTVMGFILTFLRAFCFFLW
ncbi:hypothetical protein B0H34DRAFT_449562 [Crassisporium funariophilum]|nr:hypothetical protein B0H34DRAFT_449562 [Crassisporium funariophilum]